MTRSQEAQGKPKVHVRDEHLKMASRLLRYPNKVPVENKRRIRKQMRVAKQIAEFEAHVQKEVALAVRGREGDWVDMIEDILHFGIRPPETLEVVREDLTAWRTAHDREIREKALEEACKQVCFLCSQNAPIVSESGSWWHRPNNRDFSKCNAHAIRDLSKIATRDTADEDGKERKS